MLHISVFIRKESDGYRVYWSHRSWDCIKYDSNLERLANWLKDRRMIVIA